MRFPFFFDRTFTPRSNSTSIAPRRHTTTESSRSNTAVIVSSSNNNRDEENRGIFEKEDHHQRLTQRVLDEESLAVDDCAGAVNKESTSGKPSSGANMKGDGGNGGVEESIMKERAPVVTLEIDGMTCAVCVGIVENLLKR